MKYWTLICTQCEGDEPLFAVNKKTGQAQILVYKTDSEARHDALEIGQHDPDLSIGVAEIEVRVLNRPNPVEGKLHKHL